MTGSFVFYDQHQPEEDQAITGGNLEMHDGTIIKSIQRIRDRKFSVVGF